MDPTRPEECDALDTRPTLRRVYPDHGPAWRAAIELGIDVGQLLDNLSLTPTERLLRLHELNRTYELLAGTAHPRHP